MFSDSFDSRRRYVERLFANFDTVFSSHLYLREEARQLEDVLYVQPYDEHDYGVEERDLEGVQVVLAILDRRIERLRTAIDANRELADDIIASCKDSWVQDLRASGHSDAEIAEDLSSRDYLARDFFFMAR